MPEESWEYIRAQGWLLFFGAIVHTGYSGKGCHKNDPNSDHLVGLGPLPAGTYTISKPYTHPTKGPLTMRLTPDPCNNMKGRSRFLIHGDSKKNPGTASEGCIVLDRAGREMVASYVYEGFDRLVVS